MPCWKLVRLGSLLLGLSSLSGQPSVLPQFKDAASSAGVTFRNRSSRGAQKYLPESMTGGVAAFDYDSDGRLDLFFVNGAKLDDPMPEGQSPDKSDPAYWNRLYRNNGNGTFTDVTRQAGVQGHAYGMGVTVGDFDNDGFPDLYVTSLGANVLYRNRGDGTFGEVTQRAGVEGGGWSASAAFVDYDRDGWLDLAVTRYLDWDFSKNPWCGDRRPTYRAYCHPDRFQPVTHRLYRNQGNGTFRDVSRQTGFGGPASKGLGIALHDFDRDGWPDLFVANDSWPQQLFRNRRDGTFQEVALPSGAAYDEDGQVFAGMGVDAADYDNDGWPDVLVNALANQRYALFRNTGDAFDYVSGTSGLGRITKLHSGWGMKFVDYDNDGWKDLFVAQGHVMDNIELTQPALRYLEPLLLMRNVQGRFEDVSARSGDPFRVPRAARGAAFGDLDNDGLIDAAINCNDQPAVVLRNQGGTKNHWLLVNTIGTKSNRDGIGARLRLVAASGSEQHAIVSTAGSYLSASDKRVHFGLGADRVVRLLEIEWPSGVVQKLENVSADQVLTVTEPAPSKAHGQETNQIQ